MDLKTLREFVYLFIGIGLIFFILSFNAKKDFLILVSLVCSMLGVALLLFLEISYLFKYIYRKW